MRKFHIFIAAVLLALAATALGQPAERTISAGFGVGNGQCGSAEPFGTISVDLDSDDMPLHFDLRVGPNGGCTGQFAAINAQVAKRLYFRQGPMQGRWFAFAAGGYDRGVVAHEFMPLLPRPTEPFKRIRGFEYEAVQALVGGGLDCGDNCSLRLSYDVVETPLAGGGTALPIRLAGSYQLLDDIELDANTDFTVTEVTIRREAGILVLRGGLVFGAHRLQSDAADWGAANGFVAAKPPDLIYTLGLEARF